MCDFLNKPNLLFIFCLAIINMVKKMKSINSDTINETVINKSKFITILTNVNDKNEVKTKIEYYKSLYKDATHYCSAYIIGNYSKCDDDGEPSGTAGMPILNVLQNNELTNILCIVVRYFGGIKLGAGGLVRAYSKSTSEAINIANISNLISGFYLEIEFKYVDSKLIDNLLRDVKIDKIYNENVIYKFKISENELINIENLLNQKAKIIKKESILLSV